WSLTRRPPSVTLVPSATLFRSRLRQLRLELLALGQQGLELPLDLVGLRLEGRGQRGDPRIEGTDRCQRTVARHRLKAPHAGGDRSEEHTSELPARENLVCRLPR